MTLSAIGINAHCVMELLCKRFLSAQHPGKFYIKIKMQRIHTYENLANILGAISSLKEVPEQSRIGGCASLLP
uniref:Uncharacterized protein n=1 Tax=Acrobeloides nanus TaxID=290746 RepID=A0A914DLK4_9BILA